MTASATASVLPVLRGLLRDGWRAEVGWCLGLALVIGLYLPLYPSMRSPELSGLLESLPQELVRTLNYDQIATGAGYTQATFFGLTGFALASIASIAWGAAFLAGAEESGRLELTLAHTVSRVQVVLESAAALAVRLAVLGVVAAVLILAVAGPAELDLAAGNLAAATLAWVSLALVSGTCALAGGALTGRRAWAIGAGTAVTIVGYGFNAVSRTGADLEWLGRLSPYRWAFGGAPLSDGADWPGLLLLWGASALAVAVSALALWRRDLRG